MNHSPITAQEHRSSLGSWRHLHRYPTEALERFVVRLSGLDEVRRSGPGRGIPSPTAALVITFGGWHEFEAQDPRPGTFRSDRSFVSGLRERSGVIRFERGYSGMVVDLTPAGARRLTGLPMSELANHQLTADEVFGSGFRDLEARLARAPSWTARFDLLERFVGSRIEGSSESSVPVTTAWDALVRSGGAVRIRDLVGRLGISSRRLIQLFRAEIGLPPKRVAELIRLDRALVMASEPAPESWTAVAATCGYYDQAHLINDLQDRLGVTPTALRAGITAGRRMANNLPVGVLFARRPPGARRASASLGPANRPSASPAGR